MTLELLAEKQILQDQRDALLNAFNKSVKEIQELPHISNFDRCDVLGILARNMQEVIDKHPVIKNIV